jgi:glycosyltransferase involved in cell wall biosynthesis
MKNDSPVFVILTPGFASNEADTTCLPFLQNLVNAFNKNFSFIKIIVLAFQYPFEAKKYMWNGNEVISFGGENKGKLSRLLLWRKVWKQLLQIQKNNNVIGLFSIWLGECALLGKRFGAKHSIPHKCWIVGQDAKENNKYVKRINPGSQDLIAISDFIAGEFFKNYLILPKHVITNGIDKSLFKSETSERIIDVMGAGSLIPLKQYDLFIDIVAKIRNDIPNITSIIAGKGPEKKSLEERIRHLNATGNVSMKDEIPYPGVLHLMQQSKIFLHASSYEGFSMVCLEALYAGCHVISFCKPMNIEIHHWHGVTTKKEMEEKVYEILNLVNPCYKKIFPYTIEGTSSSIMKLFGY